MYNFITYILHMHNILYIIFREIERRIAFCKIIMHTLSTTDVSIITIVSLNNIESKFDKESKRFQILFAINVANISNKI